MYGTARPKVVQLGQGRYLLIISIIFSTEQLSDTQSNKNDTNYQYVMKSINIVRKTICPLFRW